MRYGRDYGYRGSNREYDAGFRRSGFLGPGAFWNRDFGQRGAGGARRYGRDFGGGRQTELRSGERVVIEGPGHHRGQRHLGDRLRGGWNRAQGGVRRALGGYDRGYGGGRGYPVRHDRGW